jgi:hypothetical protein
MSRALFTFVTLAFVLPWYLLNDLWRFDWSGSALILYGLIVYCSFRLAQLTRSGDFRPITLTFWLFMYVWGALSAFLQTGIKSFPWGRMLSDADLLTTAVLLVLTAVAFDAGVGLGRLLQHRRRTGHALIMSPRWIFGFTLAAVASTTGAIMAVGGPMVLLRGRGDVSWHLWQETEGTTSIRLILDACLRDPPFVASFALLYVLVNRWNEFSPRSKLLFGSAFALILPLNFIANYPDALARWWLGTILLGHAFLLMPWRRWSVQAVIFGLIAAFVFIFPYTDRNRTLERNAAFVSSERQNYWSPVVPLIWKGDYDVFVQFASSVEYVRDNDYMYGRNFLGALLFWFPRQWWPDKPVNSGYIVAEYVQAPIQNLSAPFWAEAYLAFGAIGIVLILGGYGAVVGAMEFRAGEQRRVHLRWTLLSVIVPFWGAYQVFLMRGALINGVAFAAFNLFLFLVLTRWRPIRFERALPEGRRPPPVAGRPGELQRPAPAP